MESNFLSALTERPIVALADTSRSVTIMSSLLLCSGVILLKRSE